MQSNKFRCRSNNRYREEKIVYQLGEEKVDFNNILGEIKSSYPNEDILLLYKRLNTDGYLCLRQLIPQSEILNARKIFYEYLNNQEILMDDSTIEGPKSENGSCFLEEKRDNLSSRIYQNPRTSE